MSGNEQYLEWLEATLSPLYSTKAVAGHDVSHVRRMLDIGRQITHLPDLNLDAFDVAVWLHNLDRVPELEEQIRQSSFEEVVTNYLASSNFTPAKQAEITLAVTTHNKKYNDPADSDTLKALMAADKVDRLGPRGVLTSAMIHAHRPLYDPSRNPFQVQLGEDGRPLTVYDDIAGRLMEWPRMMTPESRYLISPNRMRALIRYVRDLSDEVCQGHGLRNGVEDDLKRALGKELYEVYAT